MRQPLSERKAMIAEFIQQYYLENDQFPCERDIVAGTGISAGTVHRTLVNMRENGEILYDGRRSMRTEAMDHTSQKKIIPVIGNVTCGPGQEEEEQFIEYIHMPESMIGKGEFFALIAKGESMVDVGVHPEDYVIVRKQKTADNKDIIVALLDGKNNLKQLLYDESGQPILHSRNREHAADYPDIIPGEDEELMIQGVAVGVYHGFRSNSL